LINAHSYGKKMDKCSNDFKSSTFQVIRNDTRSFLACQWVSFTQKRDGGKLSGSKCSRAEGFECTHNSSEPRLRISMTKYSHWLTVGCSGWAPGPGHPAVRVSASGFRGPAAPPHFRIKNCLRTARRRHCRELKRKQNGKVALIRFWTCT